MVSNSIKSDARSIDAVCIRFNWAKWMHKAEHGCAVCIPKIIKGDTWKWKLNANLRAFYAQFLIKCFHLLMCSYTTYTQAHASIAVCNKPKSICNVLTGKCVSVYAWFAWCNYSCARRVPSLSLAIFHGKCMQFHSNNNSSNISIWTGVLANIHSEVLWQQQPNIIK